MGLKDIKKEIHNKDLEQQNDTIDQMIERLVQARTSGKRVDSLLILDQPGSEETIMQGTVNDGFMASCFLALKDYADQNEGVKARIMSKALQSKLPEILADILGGDCDCPKCAAKKKK